MYWPLVLLPVRGFRNTQDRTNSTPKLPTPVVYFPFSSLCPAGGTIASPARGTRPAGGTIVLDTPQGPVVGVLTLA